MGNDNRFDFIRLLLASGVFVYHLIALAELDSSGHWEAHLAIIAELSIQGFFIVSGALVYGSWQRSKTLSDYVSKRARRLYPAYATVILVPALISFAMTLDGYGVARYIGPNLIFLNFIEPTLPGFFAENRFSAVNGALWTLKIEVMFYMILPVLALLIARLRRAGFVILVLMVCISLIWNTFMTALDHPLAPQLARQLPGQLMYFAAGMALWCWRDQVRNHARACFIVGMAVLIIVLGLNLDIGLLHLIGLGLFIAGLAYTPGPAIPAARWGDISYGVYIVHFPIIQTAIALGVFTQFGALPGALLCSAVIVILSYALWWWVERPALRQDSHYRHAERRD